MGASRRRGSAPGRADAAGAAPAPSEDLRAIERLVRAEAGWRPVAIRVLILLVLLMAAKAYDGTLHAGSHWFILGVYAAGSLGFGLAERAGGRFAAATAWGETGLNAGIAVYVIVEHMLAGGGAGDSVSRLPAFLLLLQTGLTMHRGHALLFCAVVTASWSAAFVAGTLDPTLFPAPGAYAATQLIGLFSFVAAGLVVIDGVDRLRAAIARALRMEHERALLARFVPEAIADELSRDADPGVVHRRHACLMVLDIRGFSRLSREHPPEAMVAALLAVRAAAQGAVAAHGGIVDKYVGDAVLVQFVVGRPDAQARAALACAGEIRDRIAALNAARAAEGAFPLRVVTALHAGDLLVGVFDDGVRAEYTVLGPAMNALSRIEARAKAADLAVAASGDFLGLIGRSLPPGLRARAVPDGAGPGAPGLFAMEEAPGRPEAPREAVAERSEA